MSTTNETPASEPAPTPAAPTREQTPYLDRPFVPIGARIIVTKRTDDFHACIQDSPQTWGLGRGPSEAIGVLVLKHMLPESAAPQPLFGAAGGLRGLADADPEDIEDFERLGMLAAARAKGGSKP